MKKVIWLFALPVLILLTIANFKTRRPDFGNRFPGLSVEPVEEKEANESLSASPITGNGEEGNSSFSFVRVAEGRSEGRGYEIDSRRMIAENEEQGLVFGFEEDGSVSVSSSRGAGWSFRLETKGSGGVEQVRTIGNRVEQVRGSGVVEWFENGEQGLQQGFTISEAGLVPERQGWSEIEISLDTDLTIHQIRSIDREVCFSFQDKDDRSRLFYHDLVVYDARGRELPARMSVSGKDTITLAYHESGAQYPITVDPYVSTALATFPGSESSYSHNLIALGDILYFAANNGVDGSELWRTDGTTEGTRMVVDLNPDGYSLPEDFRVIDGLLYFRATGENGPGLWRSDGTEDGTELLVNISETGIRRPEELVKVGDSLYFTADGDWGEGDYTNGLYRLDEVSGVGVLILESDEYAYIENLVGFDESLYFTASDGSGNTVLWKSDGTVDGTAQFAPETFPEVDYVSHLTVSGDVFYFAVTNSDRSFDLWSTDGSEEGTVLLLSGLSRSYVDQLTDVNGSLFFVLSDRDLGRQLWKSDGTSEGTLQIDENADDVVFRPNTLFAGGDLLFFTARDSRYENAIWRSDGTEEGTFSLYAQDESDDSVLRSFAASGDLLFFFKLDRFSYEWELWVSDGDTGDTRVLSYGTGAAEPNDFAAVGRTFYHVTEYGWAGHELARIDADTGELRVFDVNTYGENIENFVALRGEYFFTACGNSYDRQLWRSNGTAEGTVPVLSDGIRVYNISVVGDVLYLDVTDTRGKDLRLISSLDSELWTYDPFADEPNITKICSAENGLIFGGGVTEFQGSVYFTVIQGEGYVASLWKTDGTLEGTVLVEDGDVGASYFSVVEFVPTAKTLFFTGWDEIRGLELWKTDGTDEGTFVVRDIIPGVNSSVTYVLGEFRGELYLSLFDYDSGFDEVWKTDGTFEGTVPWNGFPDGEGGVVVPNFSTRVGGIYFFSRSDSEHGYELWRTDGTASGTFLLKDIWPGPNGAYPSQLTPLGGKLYFTASDAETGREIWETDGTRSGTRRVADVLPGPRSVSPSKLLVVGTSIFFGGYHPDFGYELWQFDTVKRTIKMIEDTVPGEDSSYPIPLGLVNGELQFIASIPGKGNTLRRIPVDISSFERESDGVVVPDILYGKTFGRLRGDGLYESGRGKARQRLVENVSSRRDSKGRMVMRVENDGNVRGRVLFRMNEIRKPRRVVGKLFLHERGKRKVVSSTARTGRLRVGISPSGSVRLKYQFQQFGVGNPRVRVAIRDWEVRFKAISLGKPRSKDAALLNVRVSL